MGEQFFCGLFRILPVFPIHLRVLYYPWFKGSNGAGGKSPYQRWQCWLLLTMSARSLWKAFVNSCEFYVLPAVIVNSSQHCERRTTCTSSSGLRTPVHVANQHFFLYLQLTNIEYRANYKGEIRKQLCEKWRLGSEFFKGHLTGYRSMHSATHGCSNKTKNSCSDRLQGHLSGTLANKNPKLARHKFTRCPMQGT